ncbi:MAG TPA: hypothetical protein EYP05_03725 [Piscirickettsiaceae bacterium]|nr:hypothetical protein [Piscirickettsiaceae bacterium]
MNGLMMAVLWGLVVTGSPPLEMTWGWLNEISIVPYPGEFRGAWVHWRDYVSPAAIQRTIAKAKRARLNVLLPLANYPDNLMYRSTLLPLNRQVAPGFDPLPALVQAAHAAGIEVHPYFVLCQAGLTKIARNHPDWWVQDAEGRANPNWIDPAKPAVREFLTRLVTDVVRTGVDGVHFDYIRYAEEPQYCYDPYCRAKFAQEYGIDPLELVKPGGAKAGLYLLRTEFQRREGAYLFRALQRFLRGVGLRPTIIGPRQVRSLSSRSVLLAGNLYQRRVPGWVVDDLINFAARGGGVIILDGPEIVRISRRLAQAIGLDEATYLWPRQTVLYPLGFHPVTQGVEAFSTRVRGNPCARATTAIVLVRLAGGMPAVTWQPFREGDFLVFNFHCYEGESGRNSAVQRLLANAVDWLRRKRGIRGFSTLSAAERQRLRRAWDEWRCRQVTELVAQMSAALRSLRPDLIVSAAGGTQEADKRTLFRDGKTWLEWGLVTYLCPMAYTRDNRVFQRRLARELEPLPPQYRWRLYAGIGVYKMTRIPQRAIEQVWLARRVGLRGVCFFSFEYLTEGMVRRLRQGPFRQEVPVPWRIVRHRRVLSDATAGRPDAGHTPSPAIQPPPRRPEASSPTSTRRPSWHRGLRREGYVNLIEKRH